MSKIGAVSFLFYRRDEARAAAEKARARKIAQEYIRTQHGRLITRPEILKQYED